MYIERIIDVLDDVIEVNPEAKEIFFATKVLTCTVSSLNKVLALKNRNYIVVPFDISKVKIIIN